MKMHGGILHYEYVENGKKPEVLLYTYDGGFSISLNDLFQVSEVKKN